MKFKYFEGIGGTANSYMVVLLHIWVERPLQADISDISRQLYEFYSQYICVIDRTYEILHAPCALWEMLTVENAAKCASSQIANEINRQNSTDRVFTYRIFHSNDLPKIINKTSAPIIYADDTSILFTHSNLIDFNKNIHIAFATLNKWLRANQLSLNFN